MEVENVPDIYNGEAHIADHRHQEMVDEDGIKRPQAVGDASKRKVKRLVKHGSRERDVAPIGGMGLPTPTFVAPTRRWKNSRRSRNGHGRGLPKKGGAGGKGVWGFPGSELIEEDYEDQNDPNYEEINDKNVELKEVIPEMTEEQFIKKTEPIILEYYEHGDTIEVARSIDEYLTALTRPMVTYVVVEVAMDHKQSQREMTSVLISDLYGKIVTSKDISKGKTKLSFFKKLFSANKCKFVFLHLKGSINCLSICLI